MNVYKVNERATVPTYATDGSACFDITPCIKNGERIRSFNAFNKEMAIPVKGIGQDRDAFQLPPGIRCLVPTGLIFDIPAKHVMKMYIRSSQALKKGLTLANGVGIIDSDYKEESFLMLENVSDSMATIVHGERIAQCLIEKTLQIKLVETDTKPERTTDREGGFGSTGE
jgi:dUTP pyrophosphatase|tara:strand:- start:1905 stop:2414 length:510 start_codon:yes stop_codon:yes gene_type:complete